MPALATREPDISPTQLLYDPPVATDEFVPLAAVRNQLNQRMELAGDSEDPIHTVVTKHGTPAGVLVSPNWYKRARAALGNPITWRFADTSTDSDKTETDES